MKTDPQTKPENFVFSADFPPGTKFFEIDDIPVAKVPGEPPVGLITGFPRPLSENTARKLAYEAEISASEFDAYVSKSASITEEKEEQEPGELAEYDGDACDPHCYAFYSEDSYPVGTLIKAIRGLMDRPKLPKETIGNLKVFLFAMQRLPLVTPGVRMSLGLRLDQGGESDWIEIRIEDDEFVLGRGSWEDGDADTETVFEVTADYRDGDAFLAAQFAESFKECARDVCREVVIEDWSDEPFTGWDLKPDPKRWGSLHCSFL
jgi:hypothetical protein